MTEDIGVNHDNGRAAPVPRDAGPAAGRRGHGRRTAVRQGFRVMARGPRAVTSRAVRWAVTDLTVAGAVLILASAIIHLRLWADGGYRGISVIGPLFLVQGVAGIGYAVVLGLFRRLGLIVAGSALMLATAGGLLLSVYAGLFGYRESLAVPYAGLSLAVEFAGAGVLAVAAVLLLAARPGPRDERVWPPAG